MSTQPPPAPTASAVGPSPTISQISKTSRTGSLPSTIASPDHPLEIRNVTDMHLTQRHAYGWTQGLTDDRNIQKYINMYELTG